MVGRSGGRGMAVHAVSDSLVDDVKDAYEGAADAWAEGPSLVYRRMADALVDASPVSLAGRLVLDLGAGTGVASAVLVGAGARPVGFDVAEAMVRHQRSGRPPASVGDALALPFRADGFDAVVAAFSLNHLPDPSLGLAECTRVTHSGGILLASTFPTDAEHPAKPAVETVLERFGYRRPPWYTEFKQRTAPLTGDPSQLAAAASAAGLEDIEVRPVDVRAGLDDPRLVVEWRLNMPQTIAFVSSLDPHTRAQLSDEAEAALPSPLPAAVTVLVLRAAVP
jgi:ubiquinone/menaquinone biosynthesis C-methylase UbiE